MIRYKVSPDVDIQPLEDELILLDIANNAYYSLNSSASWLFTQIASGKSIDDILLEASDHFASFDAEKCRCDLTALIHDLLNKKLIVQA